MRDLVPVILGLLVVCGLCLWGSARQLRRRRILGDTPTSKAQGVFIGFVELKGTAESAQPLTSFLAETACVHYAWQVDEHWSRTVTETYTDSKGNRQTRTRRESGWTTVAEGGETIPFYLRDDTGVILVRPKGASIESATLFSETVSLGHPLYHAKGPPHSVSHSDHRRRFVETGIPLAAALFIAGQARERADLVAPEIAASKDAELFVISTRSEEKFSASLGVWTWVWGVLGFVAACVPAIFVAVDGAARLPRDFVWLSFVPPAVYLGVGAVAWVWLVYNRLIALRQRVRQGWSLIDVQLKRRHDLIPRLVAIVAGLKGHEAQVQTALAALRTQAVATPVGTAGPDFAGLAVSLRAVAENYPELKANESFLALQTQLVETEQRIALARAYYNDIATQLATRLEVVPDRWVGALGGLKPEPLLAAADFERANVRVELTM